MFGYITPVAAEYVRRAIWRDATLSVYEKVQIYIFTIRTYSYVINHYRGHLPNAEQCIDEILDAPMASPDSAFTARMHRATALFDEYFRPENRGNNTDDKAVFAGAFVGQVMRIVKERSGAVLPITDQDLTRMLQVFDMTGRTVRQMLAD